MKQRIYIGTSVIGGSEDEELSKVRSSMKKKFDAVKFQWRVREELG